MNRIQEYLWFTRSDRCFVKLSYDLRTLKPQLIELNEKRKKLQIDYSVLCNASNNKCQECKGLCCGGYYVPYFSAIDYLVRMFSDKPIDDYFNWWKPRPITSILIDKIKSIWVTSNHAHAAPDSMCPNLTPIGCALEAEDRPIRCILWICNDLKKTIPPTDLRKMGVITRELSSISSEVLKCFEKTRTYLLLIYPILATYFFGLSSDCGWNF